MTQETKRTRRSRFQVAAAKKLRYSDFMGGDGAHVVLSKCPRRWRYWLHADWLTALQHRIRLDKEGCGPDCKGSSEHNNWALVV